MVYGLWFMVHGFRVNGLGFRFLGLIVKGSVLRISGSGFRFQVLVFRCLGLGFMIAADRSAVQSLPALILHP